MTTEKPDDKALLENYGLVFKETLVSVFKNYHNICEYAPEYFEHLHEMSPADFVLIIEKNLNSLKKTIGFPSQKEIIASNAENLALYALMLLKTHGFPNEKPLKMSGPRLAR